jgi:hypothetical protein
MSNDNKVEAWRSGGNRMQEICAEGLRVFFTALIAGAVGAGLAAFIPVLSNLASSIVGFVVPLLVYRFLKEVSWRSHVLALGTTVISGTLAGLFHAGICRLLANDAVSGLFNQAISRCSEGTVNATYFGAICFPLLPAGMVVLMMFVASRSRANKVR